MALLTDDIQDKLIELLVNEGLIEKSVIDDALKRASESGKPLFSLLSEEGLLDNELLVHGVAQVSGVPYVNLSNSVISQDILSLLPSDVAERFMAVPLAEVQNRLAVAMIDALFHLRLVAVDYAVETPGPRRQGIDAYLCYHDCPAHHRRHGRLYDAVYSSSSGEIRRFGFRQRLRRRL